MTPPSSTIPRACSCERTRAHSAGAALAGVAPDWALSLRVADAALYHAKSEGRDRWAGFVAGAMPSAEIQAAGDVATLVAGGNLERVHGQGTH